MIHFDFIVSDIDAENIMGMVQAEISLCNNEIMKSMSNVTKANQKETEAEIKWYKKRKEYVRDLIKKMKNSKV